MAEHATLLIHGTFLLGPADVRLRTPLLLVRQRLSDLTGSQVQLDIFGEPVNSDPNHEAQLRECGIDTRASADKWARYIKKRGFENHVGIETDRACKAYEVSPKDLPAIVFHVRGSEKRIVLRIPRGLLDTDSGIGRLCDVLCDELCENVVTSLWERSAHSHSALRAAWERHCKKIFRQLLLGTRSPDGTAFEKRRCQPIPDPDPSALSEAYQRVTADPAARFTLARIREMLGLKHVDSRRFEQSNKYLQRGSARKRGPRQLPLRPTESTKDSRTGRFRETRTWPASDVRRFIEAWLERLSVSLPKRNSSTK